MGKLIYSAITSLDGYVEDTDGNFDWAAPDEEVFTFVNDLERPIGTYLYGRRMYETMAGWETDEFIGDRQPVMVDFAEYGVQRTRSCSPEPWRRYRAQERGSRRRSTPKEQPGDRR